MLVRCAPAAPTQLRARGVPGEVDEAGVAHRGGGHVDVLTEYVLEVDVLQVDALDLVPVLLKLDVVANVKRVREEQEHAVLKHLHRRAAVGDDEHSRQGLEADVACARVAVALPTASGALLCCVLPVHLVHPKPRNHACGGLDVGVRAVSASQILSAHDVHILGAKHTELQCTPQHTPTLAYFCDRTCRWHTWRMLLPKMNENDSRPAERPVHVRCSAAASKMATTTSTRMTISVM